MNDQIKQLAKHAAEYASEQDADKWWTDEFNKKFAELIVKKCAQMADFADKNPGDYVLKHFGVEE